jgi:hypothetical protein
MPRAVPPVLLIAFNRPHSARQVLQSIRVARPRQLFIACDGPRAGMAEEAARVAEVRALAAEVDWPCEVRTRYLDENVGCARGPSEAIGWFFGEVSEGIILEDDCVPSPAFFDYAATMLDRYRNDLRIGLIAGTNLAPEIEWEHDHGFSSIVTTWGWATWRRTWEQYRFRPEPLQPTEPWYDIVGRRSFRALKKFMDRTLQGDAFSYWDYQLLVQLLRSRQLTVVPRYNLVMNTGFGGGTHFNKSKTPWWAPRSAFDFQGDWEAVTPVEPSRRFDRNYLISSHAGGGQFARAWVKLQRWGCHRRQMARPDRWDHQRH